MTSAALAALAARIVAAVARPRAKRPARLDIPRAPASERTGLTPLLVRGWSVDANDSRFRLHQLHTGLDTGYCADEKAACDKAKELERL